MAIVSFHEGSRLIRIIRWLDDAWPIDGTLIHQAGHSPGRLAEAIAKKSQLLGTVDSMTTLSRMQTVLPFERPIFDLEQQLIKLEEQSNPSQNSQDSIRNMRSEITRLRREVFENLDAWSIVQVARHPDRPQTRDYVELLFDEFIELHGDRSFGDDPAMVAGFGQIDGEKVLMVGQHKGRTLKERTACYYGCAHPEGYRKAMLKMELAAKYKRPIVCLIDTPGAYPGIGAEERGQAYTIAYNLREMSQLPVPIICIVIGEGGSGGALGIGIGDYVAVLQFAYYSVISPEGCAGILWKDVKHADKAARALRFTAPDLKRLEVIDEVLPEPLGAAHRDHRAIAATIKGAIATQIQSLSKLTPEVLLQRRYDRFRRMGQFHEEA